MYERNLAQANALLDQMGLVDCNGDRVRDLPRSDASQPCRPFVPELLTAGSAPTPPGPEPQPTPPPTILSLVSQYLNEVGIQVRPSYAGAEHISRSIQGNFDMNLIGYGALGGDADWVRIRLSSTFPALSHARIPGYNNPAFEELAIRQQVTPVAEAGEGTEEDPAPREGDPRRQVIEDMLRVVAADVPGISLVVPTRLMFFNRRAFNAWYFTPGAVWGAYPGPENKHAFITGRTIGFRASPPPYEPPASPTPSPG
jgi:ABC-type transport system substrate-binding protein